MLSAIRRICSAASAGLFTVSSSAPVRTILRSVVAVGALAVPGAADWIAAATGPALGKDTGDVSVRARLSRPVLAYMRPKVEARLDSSAAIRLRSRLGAAMVATRKIIPVATTSGAQSFCADFRESVMADMSRLLSGERGTGRGLQGNCWGPR